MDVFNEIWYKLLLLNGKSSTGTLLKNTIISIYFGYIFVFSATNSAFTTPEPAAIEVLEKVTKQRDGAPFLWRLLEESYSMEGKEKAGISAGKKAKALESSYFKSA
jgi:hypothetical protein